MSFAVTTTGLGVRYGDVTALDHLSLTIPGGTITGILGRNGAGKSTLLRVLAAHTRATSGRAAVDGVDPWEDPRVMIDTCLVPEDGGFDPTMTVKDVVDVASALRPRWDSAHADRLLERFEVPRRSKVGALSRGKRAALGAVVGLATRASLTMFDEPHLGMDAPSRYAFYDELLADYAAHPRTILLSTHLIDEAARLFEDVAILHRGRLLTHGPLDELQASGAELTGPADAVDAIAAPLSPVATRTLGRTKAAVVVHPIDDELRARADAAGVDVAPLPLQDLFVHLTAEEARQ